MSAIKVISAAYASRNKGFDVTGKCQQLVDTGNDDIPVNNNTFGDPDVGETKYFTILYTINNGSLKAKGSEEGGNLDLV